VLLAMNPSAGLDVPSARLLHARLLAVRARGVAIVVASHDLEEILALSDRVAVLYRGRIRGILGRGEATRGSIGDLLGGLEMGAERGRATA
jgi:simple sugar transport system ATP-binding protein